MFLYVRFQFVQVFIIQRDILHNHAYMSYLLAMCICHVYYIRIVEYSNLTFLYQEVEKRQLTLHFLLTFLLQDIYPMHPINTRSSIYSYAVYDTKIYKVFLDRKCTMLK